MNVQKPKKTTGFALLGTLIGMLIVGSMAAGLLAMSAYHQNSRTSQQFKYQAYYSNVAGAEYALRQARVDGNPNPIPPRDFSGEPFQITRTPNGCSNEFINVTTTESLGSATYKMDSGISVSIPSCLSANTTYIDWDPAKMRVKNLEISKISSCPSFYITGAKISWIPDGGETIKKIRLGSGEYQYNATNLPSGSTFDFGLEDFLMNDTSSIIVERIEFNTKMDKIDPTISIEWILDDGAGGCGSIPDINID